MLSSPLVSVPEVSSARLSIGAAISAGLAGKRRLSAKRERSGLLSVEKHADSLGIHLGDIFYDRHGAPWRLDSIDRNGRCRLVGVRIGKRSDKVILRDCPPISWHVETLAGLLDNFGDDGYPMYTRH